MQELTTFSALLAYVKDHSSLHNEDIVNLFVPLFKELTDIYDNNQVANLRDLNNLTIKDGEFCINHASIGKQETNYTKLRKLKTDKAGVFEVTDRIIENMSVGEGFSVYEDEALQIEEAEFERPVFIKGYRSYEQLLGHYDQKTELFICGLLMASLAFSLDFDNEDDVETFVHNRTQLYRLNKNIHPTILLVIQELTALNREKRTRETRNLIWKLENYNEYNPENESDIFLSEGYNKQEIDTREEWVLHELRSRLFEISKRNRMLYFKPGSKFLNLTIGSVPTVLYFEKVKEKNLFLWHDDLKKAVQNEEKLSLNKYLRFQESRYLFSKLDRIRSEARKDLYEYGFSQLKLVVAFLNWYNFKENKNLKINSPLLILPVNLTKKKGVNDQYVLEFTSNQAEVNPTLAHYLKEQFDIDLPNTVDLETVDITEFYEKMRQTIEAKSHGITLTLYDKPKIKLIQAIAKQKISQYNQRTRYSTTEFNVSKFDYSYNKDNYKPLGHQIYREFVQPQASYLEYLINDNITMDSGAFAKTTTRELYSYDSQGEYNPYKWEFDICNITLGNFNYKKMSLVQDYNGIIEKQEENAVFTQLFDDTPKNLSNPDEQLSKYEDNFYVVDADATQARAISKAKTGESIIIQGPPGTGKSQTITNLIADFASRGKRILFVCEKRAALDVVYARLKQNNLHHLASLVHDSQADKKEFIMDAKETYETFIKEKSRFKQVQRTRGDIVAQIDTELNKINGYHEILGKSFDKVGISLIAFIEQLTQLNHEFSDKETATLGAEVNYAAWEQARPALENLSEALNSVGLPSNPSLYSLNQLSKTAVNQENALSEIPNQIQQLVDTTDEWSEVMEMNNAENLLSNTVLQLKNYAKVATTLNHLYEVRKIELVKPDSREAKDFEQLFEDFEEAKITLKDATKLNDNWKQKWSKQDAQAALETMQKLEGKFYAFLMPAFNRVKKAMNANYDFTAHQVKPKYKQLLTNLVDEHNKQESLQKLEQKAMQKFKVDDLYNFRGEINELHQQNQDQVQELLGYDQNTLNSLVQMNEEFQEFLPQLDFLADGMGNYQLNELANKLQEFKSKTNTLPILLPYLQAFSELSPEVKQLIREQNHSLKENEHAIANQTISRLYQENIRIATATGHNLGYATKKVRKLHKELLKINGEYLTEKFKERFKRQLKNSELLAKQQDEQGKIDKKLFLKSRKILENEFNKKIRYKSIRELKSIESSFILDMIKPIWLMSPLSVSDTLPVDSNLFDVVIFDEASQITLEEGVPTLFRSNQAIIVGDEMQMPPTNFFSSNNATVEEDEEDESNEYKVAIDADSMLTHATKKLEDVMLSWHYRSKYEALIGFSNAAFYGGELLTIPDQEILIPQTDNEDETPIGERTEQEVISFHFQENGVYEKRQNNVEADYIANMVRDLLINKPELSIGVVAFSMQQQDNIEQALHRLTMKDEQFGRLLENAYERTEDGQQMGLFVKNLENVQGDERDVIIISVCYGYNHKGRMLMNFGPINRKGGEKRLNVIFSRAKKHMAIVSSIKYFDIKNEYNEGANFLRRFLQYAEVVSSGNTSSATHILDSLQADEIEDEFSSSKEETQDIILSEIQDYIDSLGYETERNVGLSSFKISLGVKDKEEDNKFMLGILLDSPTFYENPNTLDLYVLRPGILTAFGWNTVSIFKKDWYENKDLVKQKIKSAIENRNQEEEDQPTLAEITQVESTIAEIKEVETEIERQPMIEEKPKPISADNTVHLIYQDETSHKFWQISQEKENLHIKFGRVGTDGRLMTKTFDTEHKASAEKNKLIKSKLAKGYERR